MKRILQALDGASSKPVQGASDMSKFLSIVDKNDVKIIKEEVNNNTVLNEGANPHKVSLPVQMAMNHYQKPSTTKFVGFLNKAIILLIVGINFANTSTIIEIKTLMAPKA